MSTPTATSTESTAAPAGDTEGVTIELPTDLLDLLGSREELAVRFRQAVVLHLLREAEISQGKAARLLGITRWDILDLMARYQIPSGPETAEEMEAELDALERYALMMEADAGRQR